MLFPTLTVADNIGAGIGREVPRAERERIVSEELERFGLRLMPSGERFDVMSVKFRSKAEKAGFKQGQIITDIELENKRPAPEWMFIPALAVLFGLMWVQRRRLAKEPVLTS